jgi:hypothetical protein
LKDLFSKVEAVWFWRLSKVEAVWFWKLSSFCRKSHHGARTKMSRTGSRASFRSHPLKKPLKICPQRSPRHSLRPRILPSAFARRLRTHRGGQGRVLSVAAFDQRLARSRARSGTTEATPRFGLLRAFLYLSLYLSIPPWTNFPTSAPTPSFCEPAATLTLAAGLDPPCP